MLHEDGDMLWVEQIKKTNEQILFFERYPLQKAQDRASREGMKRGHQAMALGGGHQKTPRVASREGIERGSTLILLKIKLKIEFA